MSSERRLLVRSAALLVLGVSAARTLHAQTCDNEVASRTAAGSTGNGQSEYPTVSRDGTVVVFSSLATNLATGDINGSNSDAYARDRVSGTTQLISVTPAGVAGNNASWADDVSGDGRFVVFETDATNIMPGDTNAKRDIYVRDLGNGTTNRISLATNGAEPNGLSTAGAISADGRYVVFETHATNLDPADQNGQKDLYCRDRVLGTTTLVSHTLAGAAADGDSAYGALSADGRFIAFASTASNLVSPPIPPYINVQIYVFDRSTGAITLESVTPAGVRCNDVCLSPSISDDGRFVCFSSAANNLVTGDNNGRTDVFVRDRSTGTTLLVSRASSGALANQNCTDCRIAAAGRHVVFSSAAGNLVTGDNNGFRDIFLRDLSASTTELVSVNFGCGPLLADSLLPRVSGDGRLVIYHSMADNVVLQDSNGAKDVFVHDRVPAAGTYCTGKINSLGCLPTIETFGFATVSPAARFVIDAHPVRNRTNGLFVYGTTGPDVVPLGGGVLCMHWPLVRMPVQDSGGNPSPVVDCSGRFRVDFDVWIASGVDPVLFAGQQVCGQFWGRDPGYSAPFNVTLSNAVSFVIAP